MRPANFRSQRVRMRTGRIAVASLVGPLFVAFAGFFWFGGWGGAIAAGVIACVGMALGGPALVLLRAWHFAGLWAAPVGFVAGAADWVVLVTALHLLAPSNRGLLLSQDWVALVWAGAFGGAVAIIFWLIAYSRSLPNNILCPASDK
jgi:drug/metabolite transporter (DMT)-like permease